MMIGKAFFQSYLMIEKMLFSIIYAIGESNGNTTYGNKKNGATL